MTEREMKVAAYLAGLLGVLGPVHAFLAGYYSAGWACGVSTCALVLIAHARLHTPLDPIDAIVSVYAVPLLLSAAVAGAVRVVLPPLWVAYAGGPWVEVRAGHVVWAAWDCFRTGVLSTPLWVGFLAVAAGVREVYRRRPDILRIAYDPRRAR